MSRKLIVIVIILICVFVIYVLWLNFFKNNNIIEPKIENIKEENLSLEPSQENNLDTVNQLHYMED